MLTLYIEVKLTSGQLFTINPAMIVSVEPDYESAATERCAVMMSGIETVTAPKTKETHAVSVMLHISESRQTLMGRIDAIQRQAQKEYFDAQLDVLREARGNVVV